MDARRSGVDRDRVKPLHDLRATSASLQLATGADLESVRENLGWKSREIVKHYLAPYAEMRRRGGGEARASAARVRQYRPGTMRQRTFLV